ncbi:MAG TPA: AAA family ATPase [Aggregatilineaceae bacterium]|nr:AAA family ATPase [Aggregatilineaceae bacterium]
MVHLRSVELRGTCSDGAGFPFSIPIIQSLTHLEFVSPVTFLVGDNGSGKSTMLEALAHGANLPTVGSVHAERDDSLSHIRRLAGCLKLAWTRKTHRGFFMRSEDFFGYAKKQAQMREELQADLDRAEEEYRDRSSTAREFARMPYLTELGGMKRQYGGKDLDSYSHGESYLTLFQSRFVPDGLYLLDEPEAPLSPMRQLSFLVLLKSMLDQNAQFIIATHSPIIMAFPGAVILSFDHGRIEPTDFEKLDHVLITRTFLNNPGRYLSHLLE